MAGKFWRWIIFSIAMALIPLLVSAMTQATHGITIKLSTLVAHGELLLITAALNASTVGELIGSGNKFKIFKIITGGASIILLLLSAFYFADVASSYESKTTINLEVVFDISAIVYCSSLLSGLGCILLSEV